MEQPTCVYDCAHTRTYKIAEQEREESKLIIPQSYSLRDRTKYLPVVGTKSRSKAAAPDRLR